MEFLVLILQPRRKGEGLEVESANGQWHSIMTLQGHLHKNSGGLGLDSFQLGEHMDIVESSMPAQSMGAPRPFPIPHPMHLFMWLLIQIF